MERITETEFQSLFWWKYCPGTRRRDTTTPKSIKFQSLFWWKYCPGGHTCLQLGVLQTVSILVLVEVLPWDKSKRHHTRRRYNVSILVLVEVLPWAQEPHRTSARDSVSILVLVEVLPWVQHPGRRPDPHCVSILVLVEVLPWVLRCLHSRPS